MFQKLRPNQRFQHNETSTTIDDAKVVIHPDGLVSITQTDETGEDVIEIKAGTIFKIADLLRATRKVITIDRTNLRDKEGIGTASKED